MISNSHLFRIWTKNRITEKDIASFNDDQQKKYLIIFHLGIIKNQRVESTWEIMIEVYVSQ